MNFLRKVLSILSVYIREEITRPEEDFRYFLDPIHKKVAFVIPPKNGCTSVRKWLIEIQRGEGVQMKQLHGKIYKAVPDSWNSDVPLPDSVERVVVIHRDGVDRLGSAYDHRVKYSREIKDRGVRVFAWMLPLLRVVAPSIRHHTGPQTHWAGVNLDMYTDIIPLKHLGKLPQVLESVLGEGLPPVPRVHKTDKRTPVEGVTRKLFRWYTRKDRALGWNGETMKGKIKDLV